MSDVTPFLGRQAATEDAKFRVISAPMDETVEVMRGQTAGPAAILGASLYLEPYDEETARAPHREAPIHTVEVEETTLPGIQQQVEAAIESDAVAAVLGGEPLVSLGGIRALSAKKEFFTILHIGPRAMLRDEVNGNTEAGGCVMRRALDLPNLKKIVQVGVACISEAESEILFDEESKVETFFACDLAKSEDDSWHEDVIQELSTPVYLSVDLSAFSRSVVPSVGYPEPGGMLWWQMLKLLRKVSGRRRIAAFDIVDLVPVEGDLNGDFAAARLCQKLMAYMVASGKML